jgi:DNA-binding LacI/PurR family transcriptional regulator
MIRLKDVAARAGVSLMTVSKVLRDTSDVSSATKAKIRRIVEEMGYVPDASARGLRTRKTKLFGLVVPSITHPFCGPVAAAVEERVGELGYDVLLGQSQDNPQREESCLRRILSRQVDGLFLYPVYRLSPTAPIYEELLRTGPATILLGPRASFCQSFPSIEVDEALASYQLTQHLIALGHRQIAFFAGPPAAPWAQEQMEGYRRALREAGIALDDHLVFSAGASVEEGQKAALQLLNEAANATAVQAVADLAALGAARLFAKQGLRIPEDLSITGFGDHPAAEYFPVPLTTVRPPKTAIGLAAAEAMQRLLRGEKFEAKRLPAEMLFRASTSAPSARPMEARRFSVADAAVQMRF